MDRRLKTNAQLIKELLHNLIRYDEKGRDYYDIFVIQTEGLTNSHDCQTRVFRAISYDALQWSLNLLSQNLIFYHLAQSSKCVSEIVLVTVATSQQKQKEVKQ